MRETSDNWLYDITSRSETITLHSVYTGRSSPQPVGATVAATIAPCIHYRRPIAETIASWLLD